MPKFFGVLKITMPKYTPGLGPYKDAISSIFNENGRSNTSHPYTSLPWLNLLHVM
jgi:hypothetical protein